jgi:hypothetical protein
VTAPSCVRLDARNAPPGFVADAAYELVVVELTAVGTRSSTVDVTGRPMKSDVDWDCAPVGSVSDSSSPLVSNVESVLPPAGSVVLTRSPTWS